MGLILLIINSAYSQNLSCKKFRAGKFEIYADTFRIELERKGNYQYEKAPFGTSKYKIEWTSECEYVLELLETTIVTIKQNIGEKYFVKIIGVKDDTYNYECRVKGVNYIDKGSITKVSD